MSSQEGADYLQSYVDGQEVQSWSGMSVTTWAEYSYTLTPGNHEFNWMYIKDGSDQDGYDAAWMT
ncbi:MAG: hypothetical protein QGH23_02350 [Dehalococcoidia bacterium]|nr:hypothetical protein [Dehalococcoidia bacterium]